MIFFIINPVFPYHIFAYIIISIKCATVPVDMCYTFILLQPSMCLDDESNYQHFFIISTITVILNLCKLLPNIESQLFLPL